VPAVYALVARNTRSPRYWTRIIEKLQAAQRNLTPSPAGSPPADPVHRDGP
jgi:hypothetical protein